MCLGLKKVFYLDQSERKVQVEAKWHEGIFLGINDESEKAVVGTPHGIVFAKSIRRVPKRILEMVCCQQHQRGNCNVELKEES